MLTRAEALLASATATVALAILSAYAPYRLGWRVSPAIVLLFTLACAAAVTRAPTRAARPSLSSAIGTGLVVAGVAAFFLAIAWPDLLPTGGGPDLTHHLVLINHIERTWKLVDDPALYPYLGDMMDYTPGGHLLIALAAAWTRTSALRMVHPVLAVTVALKAGVIFSIARRLAVRDGTATLAGVAAVTLLFVPYPYFAGSFTTHSYWPQVVSELFACAAWWTAVVWDERPTIPIALLFALFGAAAFVTWPVWVGPIVLLFGAAVVLSRALDARLKWRHAIAGLLPIALVALFHSIGRTARLQMAGTSGFAIQPSPATLGWVFLAVTCAGATIALLSPKGRLTVIFAGVIALQAAALYWAARHRDADTAYLALKMMYLAIYPLAATAAVAISAQRPLAWLATIALLPLAAQRVVTAPKPKPIVTMSAWNAGLWARDHVDRACVDYLVADGYTGYWLHLAVLDNPRDTARFNDPRTFEPQKAVERWVDVNGLRYAIVDNAAGFSKALFNGTDTLARFDPSMVIQRREGAKCPAK